MKYYINQLNFLILPVLSASSVNLLKASFVHNTPFNFNREHGDGELALSIRPESIKILGEKADRPNVFAGKVEEVQFFGMIINVKVRVNSLLLEVNVLNHVSANLKPGDDVWVELAADQIRLIPVLSGDAS